MSYPGDEPDLDAVCEFLGLADDPDSHATYATEAHRCYKLARPTRIAPQHQESFCLVANHVSCPVFQGQGVEQTTRGAAAAGAAAATAASVPPLAEETAPGPGPRAPRQQRPQRPQRPGGTAGTLGPRPRPGGISMPAATIGLIVLAVAVVGLAFLVQSLLGDDDPEISPADIVATNQAAQTPTEDDGDGDASPTQGGAVTSPTSAVASPTQATASPTTAGGNGGTTYVVQPGDFCSTIAAENGTTVEEIIAANPDVGPDCTIFEGQELIIP